MKLTTTTPLSAAAIAILSTLLSATTLSLVAAHGEPDLKLEHPGDVFSKFHGRQCVMGEGAGEGGGLEANGTSRGRVESLGGGEFLPSFFWCWGGWVVGLGGQ
jgi:hypothetical protein